MTRFILFWCIFLLTACNENQAPQEKTELFISSATSLKDVMTDIETEFEMNHTTIDLIFNFGGSGTLAQQIINGAPSDIFLSASKKDMDTLEKKELLLSDTRITFAKNTLVLIVPKNNTNSISSFNDLSSPTVSRIAIGEPESVPVGKYSKEVLQSLQVWEQVEGNVIFAKDVRQVLSYVESGNVDAGIVYYTDSLISPSISVTDIADEKMHSPIVYPAAIIKNSSKMEEAQDFLQFLNGETAQNILMNYQFKPE